MGTCLSEKCGKEEIPGLITDQCDAACYIGFSLEGCNLCKLNVCKNELCETQCKCGPLSDCDECNECVEIECKNKKKKQRCKRNAKKKICSEHCKCESND